jgi:hypothetical protein
VTVEDETVKSLDEKTSWDMSVRVASVIVTVEFAAVPVRSKGDIRGCEEPPLQVRVLPVTRTTPLERSHIG